MRTYTLASLAELTSSECIGNPHYVISGVDELMTATQADVSFLENPRYEERMRSSQAGAVFIHPDVKREEGKNYLVTKNPSLAFQQALLVFIPKTSSGFKGIHPTALIHETATLGADVTVGPYAVIDQEVVIGERTVIGAGCSIGAKSRLGHDCLLHPRATVRENCFLGNHVIIQSGAVIGSCGFGYFTDPKGKHTFLEHRGVVVLEDHVEVGANTTIDRGRIKETRIGKGTKIDNLVQIAHQVSMGEDCLVVSQVGIAGSTKIGNNCVFGGQVGIIGHLTIGPQVMFAARSAAGKSITTPGIYAGAPALPIKEHNEITVLTRNIKSLVKRVKELEEKLAKQIAPS